MGCASTRTLLLNTTSRRGKRIPTINVRWWILAALMRIIVPSVAVRAIGRTATTADRNWLVARCGHRIEVDKVYSSVSQRNCHAVPVLNDYLRQYYKKF